MGSINSYQAIFDVLPYPCLVLVPKEDDFIVNDVNRSYLTKTNSTKSAFVGHTLRKGLLSSFETSDHDLIEILQHSLDEASRTKSSHQTDILQIANPDTSQSESWYWQFKHIPVSNEGELGIILQTIQDCTDQVLSEEHRKSYEGSFVSKDQLHRQKVDLQGQVQKKSAQFEAASSELNNFIYSVSHDLRAPLRRIDGFSQELLNEYQDQLDEKGAHYLTRVREGAQELGNLIDDLLKLSRISRRSVEIEEINLSQLAKSVFNDLIENKSDRSISIDIQEDLFVEADRGLLKIVLTNLLSNAIKFTSKEEQPQITIGAIQKQDQTSYFVKDNGAGFDPEYADKLFRAFNRLHSQKDFKGTGIGLATVKRIVNLHGGTIWGESTPGKGATFFFNL
jgi:signal transduction histidine kinase